MYGRDLVTAVHMAQFPSPCGVRRVRDNEILKQFVAALVEFPSPCGVRRVRDMDDLGIGLKSQSGFPSPCGVRRVRDFWLTVVYSGLIGSFRPLAG